MKTKKVLKSIGTIIGFSFTIALITSCKKDRVCTCTTTNDYYQPAFNGTTYKYKTEQNSDSFVIEHTKKENEQCSNSHDEVKKIGQVDSTTIEKEEYVAIDINKKCVLK